MKKFAMAAVAAAAMTAGVAQAYTQGTFSNGVVVPNVIHTGATATTTVGLINQTAAVVPVFWTFFDQDSNHVTDGCFPLTPKDTHAFVWSAASGVGLEGKRGYLVFAAGLPVVAPTVANACQAANSAAQDPAALISASAFQVDLAAKDVAYTPVIDGPLTITGDLSTMGPDNLTVVAGALQVPAGPDPVSFSMRYYVDGVVDSGADTRVVVWSTGSHKGTHTVNMYNDAQERKSVNFKLDHAELDWFDPETIVGRPAAFVDGFIEWAPVAALPADYTPAGGAGSLFAVGGSVFTYSVINAPAFGAAQTILGAHL
ncbi:hypothetical protein [Acidovorax sp. sic0104]|uniref:hypothetical protein n=1 Tax=Acidovorax sp. sic0104 TaxID=2854784 RepID=UPI001C45AB03|nr:hypothetical protein [Acidovorax sp. sic0104]MBV7540248.1 hypothetical protein [Acidovorax sp. sic0104]